jgi:predicted lipoprotein with Yx(FWY)xxD motif
MPYSTQTPSTPRPRAKSHRRSALAAVLAGFATVAAVTASVALAGGTTRVVDSAHSAKLSATVVVDVHGRTLYALHPETVHHLLCKSHACLGLWPPLTVRSASVKLAAGSGVTGHLGLLRRGAGKFQVTLRGMPLYRYAGDSGSGEANGEDIKSFGGTWHAVRASTASAPAPPPMTPSPGPYPY